jgi:hypothetical protein
VPTYSLIYTSKLSLFLVTLFSGSDFTEKCYTLFGQWHFSGMPRRYPKFPVEILAAALWAKNAVAFFGPTFLGFFLDFAGFKSVFLRFNGRLEVKGTPCTAQAFAIGSRKLIKPLCIAILPLEHIYSFCRYRALMI